MGMKNKITEAFTRDEPDILSSVLRDCPEKAAAPEKPRPPRKRAMEWIAVAAALALVVSTVWSTAAYILEQAPNGFWQQGTGPDQLSGGPGVPTDNAPQTPGEGVDDPVPPETLPTDPYPTMDPYPTESAVPDVIPNFSAAEARDLALGMCGVSLDQVAILKIWEDYGNYSVYFDTGDQAWQLLIDAIDGTVIQEDAVEHGAFCEDGDYFGWKNARDRCLERCGRELRDLVGISWDISSKPLAYWMELHFADGFSYSDTLDAVTGEFLTDDPVPPELPPDLVLRQDIRDLALSMTGTALENVRELTMEITDKEYTVFYEAGGWYYGYAISPTTGEILMDYGAKEVGLRADERMDHLAISWRQARDIAMKACGRDMSELMAIRCTYSNDSYYLTLVCGEDDYEFCVDALNGSVTGSGNDLYQEDPVDTDTAVDIALEYTGLSLDQVTELAVKFDDVTEFAPCYWVYFSHDGIFYELCVNRQTGEVFLSMGTVDPT